MKNILNMVFRALSMMVVCTTAAAQTGRQAILEGPDTLSVQGFGGTNYRAARTWLDTMAVSHVIDVEYYDGLGSLVQRQSSHATPSGNQVLVQPITYDDMRRGDAKVFLPYVRMSETMLYRPDAQDEQSMWYGTRHGGESHAYSETLYEKGRTGRPLSVRKPGDRHARYDRKTRFQYGINSEPDSVRRIGFDPAGFCIVPDGYFPGGSLQFLRTVDEDGITTTDYSDAFGRLLLRRAEDGGTVADTYFVYDARDSLVCVIQPEGCPHIDESVAQSSDESSLDTDFMDRYCLTWLYDGWGNLVEYHVPGGGTVIRRYDERDRLVSERTPRMAELGLERELVYDILDRPVSEVHRRQSDGSAIQTHAWEYYPLSGDVPAGSRGRLLRETIWEAPGAGSWQEPERASCTREYSYDGEGRVTRVMESCSDGWESDVTTSYDFVGNITSLTEFHSGPGDGPGASVGVYTTYGYDARGRKTSCHRELSGGVPLSTVLYEWDPLGRLSRMKVYGDGADPDGDTTLEENISYDLRGWRTSSSVVAGDAELFSETLSYESPSSPGTLARYDGMISEATTTHGGMAPTTYGYSYDGRGRLSDARHYEASSYIPSYRNTERLLSYDLDGNITSMRRYGQSLGQEETLTFSYEGGRLQSAGDAFFSYDLSGNMTSDSSKGLTMSYNVLNLPENAVTAGGRSLTYTHLSDGTRVSVMSSDGSGRRYRGNFVYSVDEDGGERLESIAWDEGMTQMGDFWPLQMPPCDTVVVVMPDEPGPDEEPDTLAVDYILHDEWFVRDHLGNVRAVVDLSDRYPEPVVLERNDYLPFGTRVEVSAGSGALDNRYRFAGKEEQRFGEDIDLELLDFGARYYDPQMCRWTSIDPMAEKCPGYNPYCYCSGNPINRVDPDGMTDYFSYAGDFLYNDKRDNGSIRIISESAYQSIMLRTFSDDEVSNAMLQNGSLIKSSVTFSEAVKAEKNAMAHEDAFKIYEYYNTTGAKLELKNGIEGNMAFTVFSSGDYAIQINVEMNAQDVLFDNSYNLSNALNGHEGSHLTLYNSCLNPLSDYPEIPNASRELFAISAQRSHPTWKRTTTKYRQSVSVYEKKIKK